MQKVATLDEALARLGQSAVTWINIDGLGDPTLVARLGERLGLHPLALEDVLNVPQRPKVERFEKHVFVVMRTIRLERPAGSDGPGSIKDEQISMFFGTDWVVTIQERADGDSFGPLRESIRQGRGRVREMGADYLAYLLVDAVVDAYFPVLDELGDRLHALEAEALTSSSDDTLVRLQWLRHDLVFVRRAVWPMREEAAALLRDESAGHRRDPHLPARRLRPRGPGAGARRDPAGNVRVGDGGVPLGAESAAERGDEGPHRHLHDLHSAHVHRVHLRHELQIHARAELALGLPGGPRRDGRHRRPRWSATSSIGGGGDARAGGRRRRGGRLLRRAAGPGRRGRDVPGPRATPGRHPARRAPRSLGDRRRVDGQGRRDRAIRAGWCPPTSCCSA